MNLHIKNVKYVILKNSRFEFRILDKALSLHVSFESDKRELT